MPGPWDKYQAPASPSPSPVGPTEASGPWAKYGSSDSTPDQPGIVSRVLNKVESYTGAPTRAAISAAQQGQNPLTAGYNQLGKDPSTAPTGKDIVMKAGVPDDKPIIDPNVMKQMAEYDPETAAQGGLLSQYTPADVAGAGMNVAADWTNAIPALAAGKEALKGTEVGAKAVQAGSEALSGAAKIPGKVLTKTASALTGVPEADVANYAKRTPQINQMISQSGGNLSDMADQVRSDIANHIQGVKKSWGSQLNSVVKSAPADKTVPVDSILEKMESVKDRLDPDFKSDAISEINKLQDIIKKKADSGKIDIQTLNSIKSNLQDEAAYMKPGQVFSTAKPVQDAAKAGAREARLLFNDALPEGAELNNKLSQLHGVESNLNKNLIAPGKSDSALFAAGSGNNPRNAKMLSRLEDITGYPVTDKVKDLSTARTFANPGLLPMDSTGKAVARQVGAAALGEGLFGHGGAMIAGALSSPLALKAAINAGRVPVELVDMVKNLGKGQMTDAAISKAHQLLTSDSIIPSINALRQQMTQGPGLMGLSPAAQNDSNADRSPAKR